MRRKSQIGLRRRRKFAWIFGASAIVIGLLYWEQAAVIYVLSTLAMCALLLLVAFANLEVRDKEHHQAALEKIGTESTRGDLSKKEAA